MHIALDETDLKPIEDMLARVVVRAFKTIARDFPALLRSLEAGAPLNGSPVPADMPAPPQAPPEPAYGALMERPAPTPPPGAERQRKASQSLRDKLKIVRDREDGFYPRSEAVEWLRTQGVANPEPMLSKWIHGGEIDAVIVADSTLPPSKGLPGRVMVRRAHVKERNRLRLENMPARWKDKHGGEALG